MLIYFLGFMKYLKMGEDKDLSVMTSVELRKLFPKKKVEKIVSCPPLLPGINCLYI